MSLAKKTAKEVVNRRKYKSRWREPNNEGGQKIIIGSFVLFFLLFVASLFCQYSTTIHQHFFVLLFRVSTVQQLQLRRPSLWRGGRWRCPDFHTITKKKVRKEKRKWCSKMSCNSKIVVKHIRYGITKTLPSASALTHPFSLCLYMNISL